VWKPGSKEGAYYDILYSKYQRCKLQHRNPNAIAWHSACNNRYTYGLAGKVLEPKNMAILGTVAALPSLISHGIILC
jgi:hypothetical protein